MKKTYSALLCLTLLFLLVFSAAAEGEKCICGRELTEIQDGETVVYVCPGCGNTPGSCSCDCACGSHTVNSDGILICASCSKPCSECVCKESEEKSEGGNEAKIGAIIILSAFAVTAVTIGVLLFLERKYSNMPDLRPEKVTGKGTEKEVGETEIKEPEQSSHTESVNEPTGAGLVAVRLWSRLYIRPDGEPSPMDTLLASEILDGAAAGDIEGLKDFCNEILGEEDEGGDEE